jgi:hypothetical protein
MLELEMNALVRRMALRYLVWDRGLFHIDRVMGMADLIGILYI